MKTYTFDVEGVGLVEFSGETLEEAMQQRFQKYGKTPWTVIIRRDQWEGYNDKH